MALAQWTREPQKALEWMEAIMARLFLGEMEGVLSSLRQMKATDKEAQKAIDRLWQYLKANQPRVKYGALRKGGYPIGSGAIESAHCFICHVRLKRPGAWWYMERGNGMLALRCAKYNGIFDRIEAGRIKLKGNAADLLQDEYVRSIWVSKLPIADIVLRYCLKLRLFNIFYCNYLE